MMVAGQTMEGNPPKIPSVDQQRPQYQYGTFPPPPPQSPILYNPSLHLNPPPGYHAIPVGYQSNPYPAVVVEEGIPITEPRLPCCGIGIGWALFVAGFLLAAIPWYVGVFILLFVTTDYREKPGLVACTVAAALAIIPIILRPFQYGIGW